LKKISRILQYIESEGFGVSDFEKKSGLSSSYLTNTEKRGSDITSKALKKIQKNQPDHYYKIFPEEKPEDYSELQPNKSKFFGFKGEPHLELGDPPTNYQQEQWEIELVRKHNELLQEHMKALNKIIELQEKLMEKDSTDDDDQSKHSG
jgi:transcriptional regulator with XRE-family HTH domain